ncbi:hypothetical protein MKZ38_010197 [Zalerion maritima]|uniref:YCII-related domain-containing protein n=1 Tax=Zalerion maritima TaxID=339359 RepID=A0AAD5RSK4_9PEZI|nr:hypothetical protein MKZ38_010197 [Zalerion maritima]
MASSASTPKKFEWLVVIPDTPGALAKRLEVRPTHFANLGPHIESGALPMGGAILSDIPKDDDPKSLDFVGSTIVYVASSREEVLEFLKNDIYGKTGVWDIEKVQMWPFKCAVRKPI